MAQSMFEAPEAPEVHSAMLGGPAISSPNLGSQPEEGKQFSVRPRASENTIANSDITGNIDNLNQKSDKVLTELNKLKSHTQRSVDTSAGLRSNMLRVEGKMHFVVL